MKVDYNFLSEEYAEHRKVNGPVLQQLLQQGRVSAGSRVLEVGCGTGNYITAIQEISGCRVWGIDPSREMLAQARKRPVPLELAEGRAEELDFPEESFDLVFSVDVIHHLSDQQAYYRRARRILAPGGRVCTVTESWNFIRRRHPFTTYFPDTAVVDIARYPTIEALEEMMASAGFSGIERRTTHRRALIHDIQDFRDRAFSCLHLIPDEAFYNGIERMSRDLEKGPIPFISNYMMLWGTRA